MAYQRFALAKSNVPPATDATVATFGAFSPRSVAIVSTVAKARGNSGTLPDPGRAAILEADGGVPTVFAEAFASLTTACPDAVHEGQWWQAIDDASRFLDRWGDTATALGWSVADLFERVDVGCCGLVWELAGRDVIAITETTAVLGPNDRTERAWFARPHWRVDE